MTTENESTEEVTPVSPGIFPPSEVPSAAPVARYVKELIVSGYQTHNPELVNEGRKLLNAVLEVFRNIRGIDNSMFDAAEKVGLDGWITEAKIERLLVKVDPNTPRGAKRKKLTAMEILEGKTEVS